MDGYYGTLDLSTMEDLGNIFVKHYSFVMFFKHWVSNHNHNHNKIKCSSAVKLFSLSHTNQSKYHQSILIYYLYYFFSFSFYFLHSYIHNQSHIQSRTSGTIYWSTFRNKLVSYNITYISFCRIWFTSISEGW